MYGEALTLRVQFYFEAIRNWGDLPAHFSSASNLAGANPFPIRTSRDTLYDHLLADLKIAVIDTGFCSSKAIVKSTRHKILPARDMTGTNGMDCQKVTDKEMKSSGRVNGQKVLSNVLN